MPICVRTFEKNLCKTNLVEIISEFFLMYFFIKEIIQRNDKRFSNFFKLKSQTSINGKWKGIIIEIKQDSRNFIFHISNNF